MNKFRKNQRINNQPNSYQQNPNSGYQNFQQPVYQSPSYNQPQHSNFGNYDFSIINGSIDEINRQLLDVQKRLNKLESYLGVRQNDTFSPNDF